jgi:hypothetical protein
MIILKILGLVFWLLVIPVGLGLLFRKAPKREQLPEKLQTTGVTLLIGYLLLFALLEIVGIPVMLFSVYHGYSRMVILYAVLLVLGAGTGYGFWIYRKKKAQKRSGAVEETNRFQWFRKEPYDTWEGRLLLILFLLLVGFQLYMAFTRASFDGDDAYYVVQALTAQQTDTLYRIDPNRGVSVPLDARHALALFPIWEAFVGTMCGIHATIMAHSVVPLLLIPLTYLIYYEIGRELFCNKKRLLPMFLALMALWQMFGNVSIYTTETFFLTRTWQGKSFAGNFIIPAVFWIFLCLFRESDRETRQKVDFSVEVNSERKSRKLPRGNSGSLWMMLTLLNLAAGASSSLAVLLSCALTMGLGVLLTIRSRRFRNLIYAGLSCILGGAYVLLYMML